MGSLQTEKKEKTRSRMSYEQIQMLEIEYERNPNWVTRDITNIAQRLQLSRTKIYKWHWDRKKKDERE